MVCLSKGFVQTVLPSGSHWQFHLDVSSCSLTPAWRSVPHSTTTNQMSSKFEGRLGGTVVRVRFNRQRLTPSSNAGQAEMKYGERPSHVRVVDHKTVIDFVQGRHADTIKY